MPKHLKDVIPQIDVEDSLEDPDATQPMTIEHLEVIDADIAPMADSSDASVTAAEERMRMLEEAEIAVNAAFQTGRADRYDITRAAREDANEAVRMVEEAMDADEMADEATRVAVIAENMGDHQRTKTARKRARVARREAKQAHKAATKAAKEAYDAIKFSQPGKLGFMRLVQVFYAISIASTLFALLLTSRDTITYDSVTIVDWVTIIMQGVGFWFFVNYFKITKPYVIATSAFGIAASVVTGLVTGTLSFAGILFGNLWNIFLILYFSLSKRVDEVLVNDFASYKPKMQAEFEIKRRGWPFVRNLIIYFIVFSVLGHWMEAGMCQFIRLGWVQGEYDPTNTMLWRDWLYPYPMEGAAVVIIALVLYPLWRYLLKRFEKPILAYAISFLANALTCTLIEFTMGLLVNSNYQLWDYRENFGNIMGQVCLQNALAFGVAASLIAWVVYPLLERWLARIPNDTMNIVFVVIAVIGGILWSLYIIDPPANHETAAEQVRSEEVGKDKEAIAEPLGSMIVDLTMLSGSVDNAEHLSEEDKQKLQESIDVMLNETTDMTTVLADAA